MVVFEVQQNSDVTFRLYDWARIDTETKKPRPLQVEHAFACINFGASNSAWSRHSWRPRSLLSARGSSIVLHFCCGGVLGQEQFTVGAKAEPRVLVGIKGSGQIVHNGTPYAFGKGDVWLLPAEAGECAFQPQRRGNPAGDRNSLITDEVSVQ